MNRLILAGFSNQYFQLIFGLAAIIALMALCFFMLRRLSKNRGGTITADMKIVARMVLSRDTTLMIVKLGVRLLALSVGRDGARLICELNAADLPEEPEEASFNEASFWTRFWHNLKVNLRILPKGTPYMTPGKPEERKSETEDNKSFETVLRKIAEQKTDPVPGAQSAGDSGYNGVWMSNPDETPRNHMSYQTALDNLSMLKEPDRLDRRATGVFSPQNVYQRPKEYRPPTIPGVRQTGFPEEMEPRYDAPRYPQNTQPYRQYPQRSSPYESVRGGNPYREEQPEYQRQPVSPPQTAQETPQRVERIDKLLDLIAERQSHYEDQNRR